MSTENQKINQSLFLVKHRKKVNVGLTILLILLGLNITPIIISELKIYDILIRVFFYYAIIDMGRVFKTINQKSLFKTFFYAFSLNLTGLMIVLILEYGQVSFYRALSFGNIFFQLSLRPVLFTIGSLFKDIKLINKNE